jgi:hypothetical protein
MPTSSRQPRLRACGNCESPTKKLGRLVVRFRAGPQRTLLVCTFCYWQLALRAKNRPVR